jgi:hypothetical protein
MNKPTEQDIERALAWLRKELTPAVLRDLDAHEKAGAVPWARRLAAEFAAVREEAIAEKPSEDAWTGERREVVISTRSGMNYHFLLPIPAADALVEAESRGYLAGLDAAYRLTEGTCDCGANICAEIERVNHRTSV